MISISASAGVWEADPSARYVLDATDFAPQVLSPADREWARSVPSRVGAADPKQWRVLTFVRSSATLTLNGEPVNDAVFVHENDPDEFLIFTSRDGAFLVEFGRPGVSSLFCGGVSGHRHPSRRLAVLLVPIDAPYYRCVPVDTASLTARRATWY
jgi:hypothetical protein